jgi:hypothetical protein
LRKVIRVWRAKRPLCLPSLRIFPLLHYLQADNGGVEGGHEGEAVCVACVNREERRDEAEEVKA